MRKEDALKIMTTSLTSFDYGDSIHEDEFRSIFGVVTTSDEDFKHLTMSLSKQQIRQQLEAESLAELKVSSVVKDILHEQGKHLYKTGRVYHVALPSENEDIAARYRRKASRAIRKATKLTSNTPSQPENMKGSMASLNYMMEK